MIAGGAVLVSIGATALIAGPALFAGGNQTTFVCNFGCSQAPPDSGAKAGGVVLMVLGLASLAAGIPMIAIGAQKVPDRDDASALVPRVRVGAGSASLGWTF
jgi:hypothetical protein